jgi:serine/threonine protein kinase
MEQVGGRLLGRGVFGCTFEPAPPCAGGRVFKEIDGAPAVGKVTVEDPDDELVVGRAIMSLPLAKQYFALPTAGCTPVTPVNDPDVKRCGIITDRGEKTTLSMLLMPTGGSPLSRVIEADKPWLASHFVRLFVHLLEGMQIYHEAGFVHNDIHDGNILVDSRGVARYIDFGLAFRLDAVKRWEDSNIGRSFRPKYVWTPPEVHAMRMYFSGVSTAAGVAELFRINPDYGVMERMFPKRERCVDVLTRFMMGERKTGGVKFLQEYGKRFDWWRIGFCMFVVWTDLLTWSGFWDTPLYRLQRDRVLAVIGGMTEWDPRLRWSPARALEGLRALL